MIGDRDIFDDATREAAASWFVRLQREEATAEHWLAFDAWLAQSPAHLAAYEAIEALSLELDEQAPALLKALTPRTERDRGRRWVRPARRTVTRRVWLGGAGGALAAGLAAVLLLRPQAEQSWTEGGTVYEAAPGHIREVHLPDGTHIRLNAGSRIAVRLDGKARRVLLSDAEATFDVAHDPARPFLIRAGDREIRVVGTEFNLRRRSGRVVLTVRRGTVEVRPTRSPEHPPTRVTVGQQLVHDEASGRATLTAVDPEEAFGWTSDRLLYRDAPLSEVAADLGRRFARPVRFAEPELARVRFTGVLVLDDEAAVFQRLSSFVPVRAARDESGAVVLHRR